MSRARHGAHENGRGFIMNELAFISVRRVEYYYCSQLLERVWAGQQPSDLLPLENWVLT